MTAIILAVNNGIITATSNEVAVNFGKRHDNVIRAIDSLDCSDMFRLLNFEEASNIIEQTNGGTTEYRAFNLTRDGFAFLCMGFTGKEAAQWKEKYIAAFNAMEAELKQGVSASDPADIAMRSMIGKQFLMTVCELPDGRTFHSIQPVLYPSFVICMKDIPELLARHGMAIVQKDALDGLTRFTR
jgi:Rha family phage regulatory protein